MEGAGEKRLKMKVKVRMGVRRRNSDKKKSITYLGERTNSHREETLGETKRLPLLP